MPMGTLGQYGSRWQYLVATQLQQNARDTHPFDRSVESRDPDAAHGSSSFWLLENRLCQTNSERQDFLKRRRTFKLANQRFEPCQQPGLPQPAILPSLLDCVPQPRRLAHTDSIGPNSELCIIIDIPVLSIGHSGVDLGGRRIIKKKI